jgi:hypothetical protein
MVVPIAPGPSTATRGFTSVIVPLPRRACQKRGQTKRYAAELTAGTEHERFDFTLGLLVGNLATR